jgi:hypothetical protein
MASSARVGLSTRGRLRHAHRARKAMGGSASGTERSIDVARPAADIAPALSRAFLTDAGGTTFETREQLAHASFGAFDDSSIARRLACAVGLRAELGLRLVAHDRGLSFACRHPRSQSMAVIGAPCQRARMIGPGQEFSSGCSPRVPRDWSMCPIGDRRILPTTCDTGSPPTRAPRSPCSPRQLGYGETPICRAFHRSPAGLSLGDESRPWCPLTRLGIPIREVCGVIRGLRLPPPWTCRSLPASV